MGLTPRIRLRANLIFYGLALVLATLTCRIAYLQILHHERYAELKHEQGTAREVLVAERGKILDVNGRVLALSVPVQSLYAVPPLVVDKANTARFLAQVTGQSADAVYRKLLDDRRQFIWIARHLTDAQAEKIKAFDLPGIGMRKEYRRSYPNGTLAAHILGAADIDQRGIDGLEREYDDILTGKDGYRIASMDAMQRGYVTEDSVEVLPVPGQTVQLTIDMAVQAILEESLAATAKQWKAESVSGMVIDSRTGAVIAMANVPTFDPNHAGDFPPENRRNRCLTDSFEPGSMLKQFVVSAAIEQGAVTPETTFNCENGFWAYRARKIKDVHRYGIMPVAKIIEKSSNVGTVKIGLKLQELAASRGENYLRDCVLNCGFGVTSGIDLPGEEGGKVTRPERWSYHSDVSVCQGYEIAVTPLQMAMSTSIIANRGTLMKPYVVKRITAASGEVRRETFPTMVHRVFSEKNMEVVSGILETVVRDGTAKKAQSKEYRVAGKTGTSHKTEGGRYANKYFSSFVGYAPAEDPVFTCFVSVNNPKGYSHYGGTVAAPAVGEVLVRSLKYMKVSPSEVIEYVAHQDSEIPD